MNAKTMLFLTGTFLLARAHAGCDMSVYSTCQIGKLDEFVFSSGGTQCHAEQVVVDNTFECLDESECCEMKNDVMPPQRITEVQSRCPTFRVPVCGDASSMRRSKSVLLGFALLMLLGVRS